MLYYVYYINEGKYFFKDIENKISKHVTNKEKIKFYNAKNSYKHLQEYQKEINKFWAKNNLNIEYSYAFLMLMIIYVYQNLFCNI